MDRIYDRVVQDHFSRNRQMLFLHGPRQVGKTTTAQTNAKALGDALYLNFDNLDDRRRLLLGPAAIVEPLGLDRLRDDTPTLILDELHKLSDWKTLLKGLFDTYGDRMRVLVTGSARLGVFGRGGDSLISPSIMHKRGASTCFATQSTFMLKPETFRHSSQRSFSFGGCSGPFEDDVPGYHSTQFLGVAM